MKNKLSKMPPTNGAIQQQMESMRSYYNRLVDELTRALEAQDAEIERLRKEIKSRDKK